MNILSLFDGISCTRVALEKANIPIRTYYASEIEPNAIKVSQKNYPDIVRLGDVRTIHTLDEPIDLLIGGSPCQDLSIAKKDRQGLEGNRSSLFWEYIRLKNDLNPRWFILENVASMPKKDKDIITEAMGVEPVLFNASLVSAQCRKRLFWTNIDFELPDDQGILLKHILQPDAEVDERMVVKGKSFCLTSSYSKTSPSEAQVQNSIEKKQRTMVILNKRQQSNLREVDEKAHCLTSTNYKGSQANGTTLIKIGHLGQSDSQANRIYDTDGKSATLSANGGGLGAKTGLYAIGRNVGRRLNKDGHREDGNTDIPIQRRIEVRDDEKSGTLTSVTKDNLVVGETKIRKLTPIECERLQGLPDNYTEGIAITNRYKCLGNAFNVDVITHILRHIQE